ncbi:MAG: hypothetical protein ACF8Q5_12355 [Phycisphaerales bacterium JB040]
MLATHSITRTPLSGALSSLVLAAGAALAQPETSGPVLDIRAIGLSESEPHEKDRAAYDAFMLLGDRLGELGDELDMEPAPRAGLALLWDMLNSQTALRIDLGEAGPGFAMAVLPAGAGGAAALTESLGRFMTESGIPMNVGDDGAMRFDTPIGPASISMGMGEGQAFTLVRAGEAGDVVPGVRRYGLADDATPEMSMMVDLERLGSFLLPMIEADEPELAALLEESGWFGPGAPSIEYAAGTTDQRWVDYLRLTNGRELVSRYTGGTTLSSNVLRAVPRDASVVSAAAFELGWLLDMVERAAAQSGEDPFGEAEEFLGVDVRTDLLENLGPRWVYYQAGSTGGGGVLSSVLHVELKDAEAFGAAHASIVELVNQMAAENANGYARVRSWDLDGADVFSMTFPGIPIPLEPTWAVRGDRLIAALSPAGMRGALAQLRPGGDSLLDNRGFADAVLEAWPNEGAVSVTWVDTAELTRAGYGPTNLLLSGLANAVRSPDEPERSSVVLMPPYADFVDGVEPFVEMGYWDGADLVYRSAADRSVLVQLAQVIGAFGELQQLYTPAMTGGVLLPALGKARESAKQVKAASQIRGVVQAVIVYGHDHDNAVPPSVQVLIEGGYLTPDMLASPYGEAFDGPDIAVRLDLPGEALFGFESDRIVAIDRSMLLYTGQTNVGFADGHVELLSNWELEDHLAMEINAGAREALQIP